MSKTAGIIKATTAHDIASRVHYNLQAYKTEGSWLNDTYNYHQSDLISFHGNCKQEGLSIRHEGNKLINDTRYNIKLAMHMRARRYWDPRWSQCHTIVQSFDYKANPQLSPKDAHAMGNQLYQDILRYMKARYGYIVDDGMVSTHLDDNSSKQNPFTRRWVQPHLHNHIIIPSYNAYGLSISPYMRDYDLYQIKGFNDTIMASPEYGLNDYYFNKLHRLAKPYSSYKLSDRPRSNPELAWQAFKVANDYAWDKDNPMDDEGHIPLPAFKKTRHDRDQYLTKHFQFQPKISHDQKTGQPRRVYTMGILSLSKNGARQWQGMRSLRILQWLDRKEMKSERLYWQLDFTGMSNKIMTFKTYEKTMQIVTQKLPSLNKIATSKARQNNRISLYKVFDKVVPNTKPDMTKHAYIPEPKDATSLGRFAKKSLRGFYMSNWSHSSAELGHFSRAHDYLIPNTSKLVTKASLIHNKQAEQAKSLNDKPVDLSQNVHNRKPLRHHDNDIHPWLS